MNENPSFPEDDSATPVAATEATAGDPAAAILLMAMGYDVLSMSATNLPRVKSVIRNISLARAKDLLLEVMLMESASVVEEHMEKVLSEAGMKRIATPIVALV